MDVTTAKSTRTVMGAALATDLAIPALAGHTNTVLKAHLDDRNKVPSSGNKHTMVGDPNGRGEAYVFGIEVATPYVSLNFGIGKIAGVVFVKQIISMTCIGIYSRAD